MYIQKKKKKTHLATDESSKLGVAQKEICEAQLKKAHLFIIN